MARFGGSRPATVGWFFDNSHADQIITK
jgi:hypothetical protein